jgi:hypothetical protein
MKKLNLNVAGMNATEILSREELKKVLGGENTGSGTSTGSGNICAATSGNSNDPINYCTNDASRAESWSGSTGWWCCNCQEAINHCKDKLN